MQGTTVVAYPYPFKAQTTDGMFESNPQLYQIKTSNGSEHIRSLTLLYHQIGAILINERSPLITNFLTSFVVCVI